MPNDNPTPKPQKINFLFFNFFLLFDIINGIELETLFP